MSRLAALLLLTAAFAPAAVLGALPLVAPFAVLLVAIALAISAFEPVPVEASPRRGGARRAPAHRRPR